MSVVAPVYDKSDPRQEKLYPYHIPPTPEWAEEKDLFGQGAMMGAGAGMFIRNPLFIWGSMLMGLVNFVNQKPLRTPSDAGSPLATLGMGIMGIVSLAVPKMTMPAGAAAPAPVVSA